MNKKTNSDCGMEFHITKPNFSSVAPFGLTLHETSRLNKKAEFATELISRWGMVAGKPDGEDKAGRSKFALLTEQEVVDRAVKTTNIAFEAFQKQGWILELPSIENCIKMVPKKGDDD